MKKIITGFHAIEEILKAEDIRQAKKQKPQSLKLAYSKTGPRVKKILALAEKLNIKIKKEDEKHLNALTENLPLQLKDHRGLVLLLETEEKLKLSVEEFLANLFEKEIAKIVILDSITDPHNIGSILRSADQFNIDGIILPENNSAGSFETIARISSGASAWVPILFTNNLVRIAESLKKEGFWIYGADIRGAPIDSIQFPKKTVIVMGSEGRGISRLLKQSCDHIISIPTNGRLDSLNVSVAAGIIFYELSRKIN